MNQEYCGTRWGQNAVLGLIALCTVYWGSYLILLNGKVNNPRSSDMLLGTVTTWYVVRPNYHLNFDFIESAWEPAHQIDRRLRPDYWREFEHKRKSPIIIGRIRRTPRLQFPTPAQLEDTSEVRDTP